MTEPTTGSAAARGLDLSFYLVVLLGGMLYIPLLITGLAASFIGRRLGLLAVLFLLIAAVPVSNALTLIVACPFLATTDGEVYSVVTPLTCAGLLDYGIKMQGCDNCVLNFSVNGSIIPGPVYTDRYGLQVQNSINVTIRANKGVGSGGNPRFWQYDVFSNNTDNLTLVNLTIAGGASTNPTEKVFINNTRRAVILNMSMGGAVNILRVLHIQQSRDVYISNVTFVEGTAGGLLVANSSNVVFANYTHLNKINQTMIDIVSSNNTRISEVVIRDFAAITHTALVETGIRCRYSENCTVQDSTLTNMTAEGIYILGSNLTYIQNVTITSNLSSPASTVANSPPIMLLINQSDNTIVANSTIRSSSSATVVASSNNVSYINATISTFAPSYTSMLAGNSTGIGFFNSSVQGNSSFAVMLSICNNTNIINSSIRLDNSGTPTMPALFGSRTLVMLIDNSTISSTLTHAAVLNFSNNFTMVNSSLRSTVGHALYIYSSNITRINNSYMNGQGANNESVVIRSGAAASAEIFNSTIIARLGIAVNLSSRSTDMDFVFILSQGNTALDARNGTYALRNSTVNSTNQIAQYGTAIHDGEAKIEHVNMHGGVLLENMGLASILNGHITNGSTTEALVYSNASGFTMSDSRINGSSTGIGVNIIQSNDGRMERVNITAPLSLVWQHANNTKIFNATVVSFDTTGMQLFGAVRTEITNSTFEQRASTLILCNSNISFVNTTFGRRNVVWFLDLCLLGFPGQANISVAWYVNMSVRTANDLGVPTASVNATDLNNLTVIKNTTDTAGNFNPTTILIEYRANGTYIYQGGLQQNYTPYTPHNFTAFKTGYSTNSTNITMDHSQLVIIYLEFILIPDDDGPEWILLIALIAIAFMLVRKRRKKKKLQG